LTTDRGLLYPRAMVIANSKDTTYQPQKASTSLTCKNEKTLIRILLKFYGKNGKLLKYRHGDNPRVLSQRLASLKWQKAYLKVVYGKDIDCLGRRVTFYNDGFYLKVKNLKQAFRAFIEK
jgi:hypothetical protein